MWLVSQFDRRTVEFQDSCADILTAAQYEALFELSRDERVVLTDPSILNTIY